MVVTAVSSVKKSQLHPPENPGRLEREFETGACIQVSAKATQCLSKITPQKYPKNIRKASGRNAERIFIFSNKIVWNDAKTALKKNGETMVKLSS